MSFVWKRLPDRRASGAWQMAADDWMLSRAESGDCLFRVYEFEEPTVSLGYFQSWERLKSVPSLARLPWVRRQTGGDLLVHDNEITYAIAAPIETLGVVRDFPCRVHRAVSEWLKTLGIETQCQPEAGKISREGAPAGMLCFLHPAAGDVLFQGCKVMGSAQRKRHGAVLHHRADLQAQRRPGQDEIGAEDNREGEADDEEARTVRMEHARARYGEDFSEKHLVQETAVLHAVHFRKGCYLGQEIVERVKSRGQVHKLLRLVELNSPDAPAIGAKLTKGGEEAGEIVSSAYSPALQKTLVMAYMRTPLADTGTAVELDGVSGRVRSLPQA